MAYMNVQIKLNDVDISQYVISYTREHKICTGIGTLSMDVTYELVNDLIPWDAIDIYENSEHVGTYYVGSVTDNQPSSTLTIEAQDNSKRLSDYFITDTYLIDYISYTKYWIEYFLTEVGIQYEFLVSGDGALINQNSSFGLMSAYEQIQTLLQMSGWYITFNTSGKALIGKLTTDVSTHSHRFNLHDMTEFKLTQSDKMYRNRALVWGTGSPSSGEWVFADVTKHTRWDYDNNDLRTMVIANSAIPDVASAFMLANQLLIEFCRLNEEKDMTLIGTYNNLNVGSSVFVNTRVWTGAGLVTTFGVNMTRSGLTTHVILDERCPRLYGFFDVGGKVYVGTYGSGVWRHDIKYLGALWEDYSSGVAPQTTDLHVNNGVLVAVGAGGDAYYNLEGSLPWNQFPISNLPYVLSGEVVSGIANVTTSGTISSGLMARACIIDRLTNRLKFAVDTRSGYNLGDYLMETDPLTLSGAYTILSGFASIEPSGLRSWIVDGSPYDGSIGAVYPVHVSGEYSCAIFDIENDSFTDYVSVGVLASGVNIPSVSGLYNFGFRTAHSSQGGATFAYDDRLTTAFNSSSTFLDSSSYITGLIPNGQTTGQILGVFNNTIIGERDLVYWGGSPARARRLRVLKSGSLSLESSASTTDLPLPVTGSNKIIRGILHPAIDKYVYYYTHSDTAIPNTIVLRACEWDVPSNTLTDLGVVTTIPSIGGSTPTPQAYCSGSTLYLVDRRVDNVSGYPLSNGRLRVRLHTIDLETGDLTTTTILDTDDKVGSLPEDTAAYGVYLATSDPILLAPYFGGVQVLVVYSWYHTNWTNTLPIIDRDFYDEIWKVHYVEGEYHIDVPILQGHYVAPNRESYVSGTRYNSNDASTRFHLSVTETKALNVTQYIKVDESGEINLFVATTGFHDRLIEVSGDPNTVQPPFEVDTDSSRGRGIIPLYGGNDSKYLAYNPANSTYYEVSAINLGALEPQSAPPNFYVYQPFVNKDTVDNSVYWLAWDIQASMSKIISRTTANPSVVIKNFKYPRSYNGSLYGWFNGGNFFIEREGDATYYDNTDPPAARGIQYYILQRDNDDYNVLYSGAYQQRLDISQFSPLVAMDRRLSSTQIYNLTISGVTASGNAAISGVGLGGVGASGLAFDLGIVVDDYRYSVFEWMPGHTMELDLFAAYDGDLGIANLDTLSTFSGMFLSPSGHIMKVEASNLSLPEQYTFLATSGDVGGFGFFEKTPSGFSFASLTEGFPQVRPTIIRLDDKL